MKNNIAIIDVETGGTNYLENPITQLSLTAIEPVNFSTIKDYTTFVKPYEDLKITPAALEHSRVTMKQINNGIEIKKLVKDLILVFKELTYRGKNGKPTLAGHNFGFDIDFLEYAFKVVNQDLYTYVNRFHYCTMRLYVDMEGGDKNSDKLKYNLTNLSERYGIELTSAHGAEADANVTKELLIRYLKRVRNARQDNNENDNTKQKSKSRGKFVFEF